MSPELLAFWLIVHTMARLSIAAVCVVELVAHLEQLNWAERHGLAIAGGSGILTIPAILKIVPNPFETWAGALFSIGILIYVCGRHYRLHKHKRANEIMKAQAQARRDCL
jgi:hypothetical protein